MFSEADGSPIHLAISIRPDIAYAVLLTRSAAPSLLQLMTIDLDDILLIFQYLQSTKGLLYCGDSD